MYGGGRLKPPKIPEEILHQRTFRNVFFIHNTIKASKVWPALGAAPDEIVSEGELGNQLSIFFTTFKLSNYEPLVFDQVEPNNLDIWSVKVGF